MEEFVTSNVVRSLFFTFGIKFDWEWSNHGLKVTQFGTFQLLLLPKVFMIHFDMIWIPI